MAAVEFEQPELLPLPDISAILPVDADICVEEEEDDDIYRGLPSDQAPPPMITIPQLPPRPESSASGSSSSSSSRYSGRLGALAAVVESAITRWARRNSSSSSINSSASSASSVSKSTSIQTKSTRRRRRRYSADHNARSERDILVRLRARQETRRVPRGFSLYVPPQLRSSRTTTSPSDPALQYDEQCVLRTHLLPIVLNRVQHALRLSEKLRQPERLLQKGSKRTPAIYVETSSPTIQDCDRSNTRKGKQRDSSQAPREHVPSPIPEGAVGPEKGSWPSWWLDVSSPTYADMKALGKLLHLHPLTLEDILHQDQREKMELFPKLGYYFIVFKAIESTRTRERLDRLARRSVDSLPSTNDGVIGEDLIYLVVLRDGRGICTFHFTDISEHIDRVREKVLLLSENTNRSSDWIAHGILDSVVDSFFPFIAQIDKEVDQVEKFLYSDPENPENVAKANRTKRKRPSESTSDSGDEKVDEKGDDALMVVYDEKPSTIPLQRVKTAKFKPSPVPISLHIRRARKFLRSLFFKTTTVPGVGEPHAAQVNPATLTVYRMAKIRRLVTSLTRLLSTKTELIAQIRKRLVTRGEWSLDSDPELYVHLGDILDHILSLQQGLAHYEWMMAESHPIYLSQLGIHVEKSKNGRDKAVMILTIVSVGVVVALTPIGVFSMNVTLPANGLAPGYPFYMFGAVITIEVVVACFYLLFIRRAWRNAKKRARRPGFRPS